jgi:hypothetical protein
MARHRVARRGGSESGGGGDGADVDMGDVTRATLPASVPQNPDGTPAMEGEVSEAQARSIGALSIDSARKNKRNAQKLLEKTQGKSVPWNAPDALELIDALIIPFSQEWGSMIILVAREEPGPRAQFPPVLGANVRTSIDLYNYIASQHGTSGPAVYKVSFRSSSGAERGASKVWMPDMTPKSPVQVITTSAPQQPPQQQPPQQYGGSQGGQPGGWGGSPPQGYWQQQPPQPPQQQQPSVIVVSQPPQPQQQAAPQAPAPAPAPQPIYTQPPAPASGGFDPQRAMFEMMQAQSAATMATLKDMVAEMKRPQPPAGFIALPSEQYPVPPGYVRVPGGMMPAPPMAAYTPVPVGPTGVGQVPVAVTAAPAQPAQVIVQAPPPPPQPSFGAQIKGTVSLLHEAMSGMKSMQDMFTSFAPQQPTIDDEPDDGPQDVPQVPPAMLTQDVGGISMALDRATGKVAWAPTIVGALPKISEFFSKGVDQYRKIVDHQAALTAGAVRQRIELANAVARVQQPQAQVLPASIPTPPVQAVPPVQAAPPPRPQPPPAPPVAPKKPTIPMPTGPLWG